MLPLLLAVIAVDLDASVVAIGLFLGLAQLAGLAAPVAGWLVGRLGVVRVVEASLVGFAVAAAGLAVSPGLWILGPLLICLGLVSMTYEVSATAWISQTSTPDSRSRSLGRFELAWSLGLLVGVPAAAALAGLSWRLPYLVLAAIAATVAERLRIHVARRPREPTQAPRPDRAERWKTVASRDWGTFAAFGLLAAAAQSVIVVFGLWLTEDFGYSVASIGGVAILFGLGELVAVLATIRLTDRIGTRRAATAGTTMVVVSAMALSVGSAETVVGVTLLTLLLASHEFALVSTKPLLANTSPHDPAIGLGIGFATAAACRSLAAITGILAFSIGGMTLAAALSAMLAAVAVSLFLLVPGPVERSDSSRGHR